MRDAVGLVDGLYPGAAAEGFRNFPESTEIKAPRISEVYTKGTLTLARLGREAPIAAASPIGGAVLRNVTGGSLAARSLYPEVRQTRPERLARSPVIGTDSPVQYEPSESPGVRRRLPAATAVIDEPGPRPRRRNAPDAQNDPEGDPVQTPARLSTSARRASRARSRRCSASAPTPASSPAATACCR